MSLTVEPASGPGIVIPAAVAPIRRPLGASVWARIFLAVTFLGVAGGVRFWQAWRVQDYILKNQETPFPLKDIPLTLGDWKGKEDKLDPEIAQATGCRDYIFRTYTDERTGVRLSVIVLFGPPMDVIEHAPDKCSPMAGYTDVDGPSGKCVPVGDRRIPFSAITFQKGEGGGADRQEVYYTWHYGQWTPMRGSTKQVERIPGMYKVHLARGVAEPRDPGAG